MKSFKDWVAEAVESGQTITAPVKPKPTTKPGPQVPEKEPQKGPWNPPRPQVLPGPKNVLKLLEASYEAEAHPEIQKFWKDFDDPMSPGKKHFYHEHPLWRLYGDRLSKQSYEDIASRHEEQGSPDQMQLMSTLMRIQSLEKQHKDKLLDIAKKVANEILGIPVEMLDPDLGDEPEGNPVEQEEEDSDRFAELPQSTKDQVYKRVTINALTHGSSIHAMYTAYNLAMRYLEQLKLTDWGKELIQLYKLVVPAIHRAYWLFSPEMVASVMHLPQARAGSSKVKYEGEKPKIVAKGVIFPVVIHELIKGGMELLSHHGLAGLDEKTAGHVIRYGDRLIDEMWLLQVGRDLWKRFLEVLKKVKDRPSNPEILQALYQKPPEEVHKILMAVIDDSQEAPELLRSLVAKSGI